MLQTTLAVFPRGLELFILEVSTNISQVHLSMKSYEEAVRSKVCMFGD